MNSVSVEAELWFSDWQGKEQVSAGRQAPGEFCSSFFCSEGVEWVAVSAQTDVFSDVEARDGLEGGIFVRHLQYAALYAYEIFQVGGIERTNIDEFNVCDGGQKGDEVSF